MNTQNSTCTDDFATSLFGPAMLDRPMGSFKTTRSTRSCGRRRAPMPPPNAVRPAEHDHREEDDERWDGGLY